LTRGTAVAVGCISLYAALFLLPVAIFWNQPIQPKVPITAHIVRIYMHPSIGREAWPRDTIVAATPAGLEGSTSVRFTDDHCHVGDVARGWQQGIIVEIDPATCQTPADQTSSVSRP